MSFKLRDKFFPGSALPCLVCGVDSGPTLTFFFWLIGGALLAGISICTWGFLTKKFQSEGIQNIPLLAEELRGEQRGTQND